MATYCFRFFFDPGAGICLWAANDAARERFGYPVDAAVLPLPENTRRRVWHLMAWYDTSLDWSNPAGPSPWDDIEHSRFNAAAQSLLAHLRVELGREFEILDESDTADTP